MAALGMPTEGCVYDLDPGRFPGMPLWWGHPPFQVLTYRSPRGVRVQRDHEWLAGDSNAVDTSFVSELLIVGCHSGAHMDALCHITCGPDDRWNGGTSADEALGDFGSLKDDASQLPALVCRGVLVDCAASLGFDRLPKSYPISLKDFETALERQATEVRAGDVVLVRTGQMSAWPDPEEWGRTRGAGITLPVADWLIEAGVCAIGADTEAVEVAPSIVDGNPHPVHLRALVDAGVYLLEDLYLEELAHDAVHEFLLIVSPAKIRGATGSFIRPLAIV
jgi:kynurenine formamidase